MSDAQTPPPLRVPVAESPDAKTSAAAISSLIFGILGIVKINKSNGMLKGKNLAISGIVLGGIGLFVSAILYAVAIPAMVGYNTNIRKTLVE